MSVRDALTRSICARLHDDRRSIDELRVIDAVLLGLEQGAETYGALDLDRDGRNWTAEAAAECRDLLVYLAAHKVAEQQRHVERIESGLSELRDSKPQMRQRLDFDLSGDGEP